MRYVFGDYELDEQLYELRRAGESLKLDRKVFDVLTYLIQHRDRLVPKDELLDTLWPGQVVGEAALTRCITSARKALGDDGNRQAFIKTQHGRGYRFVAPLTLTPPVPSSESHVPSHEAGASRQEEANQQANGKNQKVKIEDQSLAPHLQHPAPDTQPSALRTCLPQQPHASGQEVVLYCSESWGLWSGSLLWCLTGLHSVLVTWNSVPSQRRQRCRCLTNLPSLSYRLST